ncbi:MAG: ankyrin repeat domain-containing protein [Rhodospirillales bacterium]|nr:ankyrin repeat domain-containing protein [Rhodospirillales bacterium]
MDKPGRFFVRSSDGRGIAGYDNRETAEYVALEYGAGAHLVDTLSPVYHPMVQEVEIIDDRKELIFLPIGSWGTGRFSLERDLIEAIKKGHIAVVHSFLAKGADSNGRDDNGDPAICWAAASGNADIVSLLIDHGADLTVRDSSGADALIIAEKKEKREVAELLKQRDFKE